MTNPLMRRLSTPVQASAKTCAVNPAQESSEYSPFKPYEIKKSCGIDGNHHAPKSALLQAPGVRPASS
jgi:hypothetical protein